MVILSIEGQEVDSMAKKQDKNKVGRPKLADPELIKDSWCRISASLSIALVMAISFIGIMTDRTPFQVLTFQNTDKLKGSVSEQKDTVIIDAKSLNNTKIIKAKKVTQKIINTNGEVTYIIPANEAE